MNNITRILIIDDDESIKDDIIASFEKENIEIVFCPTKDEAILKAY